MYHTPELDTSRLKSNQCQSLSLFTSFLPSSQQ
jgi:hypothetical protein